jgi:hypothetical protein
MQLREIAHARAGDKGVAVTISVIAFDDRDYPHLERQVTAERVRAYLGDLVGDVVERYVLPELGALNFVVERSPARGVTSTLALDAHGKSLSSALLAMELAARPTQAEEGREQ